LKTEMQGGGGEERGKKKKPLAPLEPWPWGKAPAGYSEILPGEPKGKKGEEKRKKKKASFLSERSPSSPTMGSAASR